MKISNNTVVSFHYNLLNEKGEQIETTRDGEPSLFLTGANNILPALEQLMMDKEAGACFSCTLEAHQAYGPRVEDKKDRISAKYLKHEGKLKPGKVVRINTNQGTQTATIIKVGKFSVDIDLNHPLAGQTITFDIEIIDIREASTEEVTHGHAHGVGGHQH
jgi:FKBP-type peptidyl-prolyl cis-trans isomerase SlyD